MEVSFASTSISFYYFHLLRSQLLTSPSTVFSQPKQMRAMLEAPAGTSMAASVEKARRRSLLFARSSPLSPPLTYLLPDSPLTVPHPPRSSQLESALLSSEPTSPLRPNPRTKETIATCSPDSHAVVFFSLLLDLRFRTQPPYDPPH